MKIILTSPWHESWRGKDGYLPWACRMQADLPEDSKIYDPEHGFLCSVCRDMFKAATLDSKGMSYLPITVTQLSCRSLIKRDSIKKSCEFYIFTDKVSDEDWITTVTKAHFTRDQKNVILNPRPVFTIHSKAMDKAIEIHKKTYWRFSKLSKC